MSSESINIIVVDDHQIVLDGIARMLELDETVNCVALFSSAKEAFEFLNYKSIDLVLLDIEMPEENGIDLCNRIKSSFPKVKIVALSMLNQYNIIMEMIKSGTDGYLIKNCNYEELVKCIKEVHAGNQYFSPEINKIIKSKINKSRKDGFRPLLSSREKDVVKLILEQKTVKQISELLFISINTVDTHRKNVMKKLDVTNVAGLVKEVIENRLLG